MGAGEQDRVVGVAARDVPAARTPRPARLTVDDAAVVAVLAGCAAGEGTEAVAAAVLTPLVGLPGVRAGLVLGARARRTDPVVLASIGYGCTTMATGATLPRDAGLPVTEALRTGRTALAGGADGPGWVAVPLSRRDGRQAALLLSLLGPPPGADTVAALERLARLAGPALDRAEDGQLARTQLTVLEQGLVGPLPERAGLAVRSRPFVGQLSGDVVALATAAGVDWLLLADVSGRGHAAAVAAERLRAAFPAAVQRAASPSQVLADLDQAVRGGEEGFATALVVQLRPGAPVAASAGHPGPLLHRGPDRVSPLEVVPSSPLGLGLGEDRAIDAVLALPPDGAVVLWSDGLLDRGAEVDLPEVLRALPAAGPDRLADDVLAACEAAGPAQDDATLVVLAASSL